MDKIGNLYGTTERGGAYGWGTVFKLNASGKETVLHSFSGGADGSGPRSTLIRDQASNLYGTTPAGGNLNNCNGSGCGVVFKLDKTGKETVLYSFAGATDGSIPFEGLVRDKAGNLYGTTHIGGDNACFPPSGCGTVFKLDTKGLLIVLHRFTGGVDGANPSAALIRDNGGNLYGVTNFGGGGTECVTQQLGCGTVFKVDKQSNETVLYSFSGGADGAYPSAELVSDDAGNLYGTTSWGGDPNCIGSRGAGCGTVFKLDPTGAFTVLYTFVGGTDGAHSLAPLIQSADGSLYGTTAEGGGTGCPVYQGCGTVFKLDGIGTETVLYHFTGGADGAGPQGGLILDAADNLYGTALRKGGFHKAGVVFKITPQ